LVNLASPKWIQEPKSQSLVLNSNLTWVCKSEGVPKPIVKWEKYIGK